MTPMQQVCAYLRELYTSLTAAGFSEGQACQIVAVYFSSTVESTRGEETS